MAAVFDSAEMNHRFSASERKLRAVAQDEREHNAQLLGVLESVEKTLEHNQQHIHRLEEKRGRTLEEFQQLRNQLHVMQIGRSRLLRRYLFPKSYAARADLIDRLDVIISTMNPVAEDGVAAPAAPVAADDTDGADDTDDTDDTDGVGATENDTARARKPTRRGLALLNFMSSLAAVALVAVFGFIGSLIAEALVARKANSSMPLYLVRREKTMWREVGAHGRNI